MERTSEAAIDLKRHITGAIVGVVEAHTDYEPAQARTFIQDELVTVVMGEALTQMERHLVDRPCGGAGAVRQLRLEVQDAMRDDLVAVVENATGRKVAASMSATHIDPDLAVETFILAPGARSSPAQDAS